MPSSRRLPAPPRNRSAAGRSPRRPERCVKGRNGPTGDQAISQEKCMRLISRLVVVLFLTALVSPPPAWAQTRVATRAPLPTATPESVGFAPGALDKIDAGM